jgi:mRNA-degrading endonuclease toxin of MazEF toxin-antitoxin module
VSRLPPLRWAVLVFDLEPVVGHEQGGERRALVVSYEPFHVSGRVTICPITAARSEVRYPNEVAIPLGEAGQTKPGVILCHQVRTISILRAEAMLRRTSARVQYMTDPAIRRQVRVALTRQLGLDIPPALDGAAA